MNHINQRATKNATAVEPEMKPRQNPEVKPRQSLGTKLNGYSETEAKILQGFLVAGEKPIAKREDVIELYNRMVTLLRALNESLTEKQDGRSKQERIHLESRFDQIDGAVNSMEGALRIELAPLLSQVVEEQFERHAKVKAKKPRAILSKISLIAVGLAAGILWSDVILSEAQNVSAFIQGYFVNKF
ncbi:hypothetical protein [Neptunicoccus cionae]|uniref:Uncharacterized protein n=1 Tax=Neptunicoccus cionae TaxID=2035344 RepID=A0A916VNN3_9RHOB|nr:hypothetical protein [Amylibacter cionae]GGA12388.1 hypothetical protein GCM10011498_10360 [Amylibacter cionae]